MIALAYEDKFLVLPNPQFNESLTTGVKTQFEHSMTGSIYSFRYTAASKTIDLPITFVSRGKVDEIILFLKTYDGLVLDYYDYDGVITKVHVVGDTEFNRNGRGADNIDMYDFNLVLEKV